MIFVLERDVFLSYPLAALLKKSVSPSNGTCSISFMNWSCWAVVGEAVERDDDELVVPDRLKRSKICFNND